MEFEFLFRIAAGMLGSLLGSMLTDSGRAPHAVVHPPAVVEAFVPESKGFVPNSRGSVPSFVTNIPSGHFAGISAPCQSLSEARQSSLDDVVRQVLGSIGVSYDHRHVNRISGDVRAARHTISDDLTGVSRGLVMGISQGIVASAWSRDHGMFTYYVLVRYPDSQIAEMRRLSRGAKVVVTKIEESDGQLILDIEEINGVSVVVYSAEIEVNKRNRFAPFVSFCIWKVPEGSKSRHTAGFEPVRLCGSSGTIRLNFGQFKREVTHYLLGTEVTVSAVIRGFDEIGREVTAHVK